MSSTPDIFLSYSRDDQATARKFAEGFEREGFSVWWDQALKSGEAYDRVTEQALRDAKAVVVLWSKRSVNSDWVRAEATIGLRNKTLTPVMIEACERPIMFELTQTADLCHWQGDASDRAWLAFINDVRRLTHKGEDQRGQSNLIQPKPDQVTPTPLIKLLRPMLIAVAAMLALALVLTWFRGSAEVPAADKVSVATADNSTATAADAASSAITDKSIAVLPLDDFNAGGEDEYFADGLTEEILTALSKTPDLLVASRTSAFQYKDQAVDVKQVALALGVAHVLEGSVRRSADRLRVTVQLIRAADGFHLWSENYDRTPDDIIAVQEDIAFQIASALQTAMDPQALRQMLQAGTTSVAAYNAYLQGLALAQGLGGTMSRKSYDAFELARQTDPAFARAHERAARYWRAQLAPNQTRTDASSPELAGPAEMLALHDERMRQAIASTSGAEQLLFRVTQARVNMQFRSAFVYLQQYLIADPTLKYLGFGQGGSADLVLELASLAGEPDFALDLLRRASASMPEDADKSGVVMNYYFLGAIEEGRQLAFGRLERFPYLEGLLDQSHRLLLSGGYVDEARELLERITGAVLLPDRIRLLRLRQACADADLATASQLFAEVTDSASVTKEVSASRGTTVWEALNLMGRTQEAALELLPLDQSDTLYALSQFLSYPHFDIDQYPNLKAALERDGVPLPVYRPIPYACAAPQP